MIEHTFVSDCGTAFGNVHINTELIFALFDLLGLQFSPRIRDMANQQLYRVDRNLHYEHIEPQLSGTINRDPVSVASA